MLVKLKENSCFFVYSLKIWGTKILFYVLFLITEVGKLGDSVQKALKNDYESDAAKIGRTSVFFPSSFDLEKIIIIFHPVLDGFSFF